MTLPSPPEIFKTLLDASEEIMDVAPGGVIVGPVDISRQELGCILLAQAGIAKREIYLPLLRTSVTARAVARSIDHAERIGHAIYDILNASGRRVVRQPSLGQDFLVHFTIVTSGPTLAVGENLEIWEHILSIESLIGTSPIT